MHNEKIKKEDMTTVHSIVKNRPEVECFDVMPESSTEAGVPYITSTELNFPDQSGETCTDDEHIMPKQKVIGARIVGDYPKVVNLIQEKRKRKFDELKESSTTYNDNKFILDSYDGAQMVNNVKKQVSIISFSSQIFSERSVRELGTTAASGGIPTWMQQTGNEEPANLFPYLRKVYESKYDFSKDLSTQGSRKKPRTVDMHDAKMGYALVQHGLWNRTHTPFLLCKCSRGDAVRNADHVCKFISQEEYVKLNDKSSRQWHKNQGKEKYEVSSMILMLTTPGLMKRIMVFRIWE